MSVPADIDEVLEEGTPLVMIASQDAFTTGGNVFCVLMPLMTQDGQRFEDLRESFPNRGRVWWLVGIEGGPDRRPRQGDIITSPLELAVNYTTSNPDKERYQVRRFAAAFGPRRWLQVLELPGAAANVSDLIADRGIPWASNVPTGRVLVATGNVVVGPFNTRADRDPERLVLSPLNLGKPVVRVMDRKEFEQRVPTESFDLDLRSPDHRHEQMEAHLRFAHERHLATIEQMGRAVDASSDAQLVNWALGLAGLSGAHQRLFKEALQRLPAPGEMDEEEFGERYRRFTALCSRAEIVTGLGVEVAEALAAAEPFRDLVMAHVEEVARQRIEAAVAGRRKDVEAAIADLEKRRTRLASEYDEAKRQQEESLARDHASWVAQLDAQKAELDRREQALGRKEKDIADRLERLIERFGEGSTRVADDILAQLPILRRLGLGGGASSGPAEPEGPPRAIVAPFVSRPVPRQDVTETAFLDQLRTVVAARGFAFSSDDLTNFHVAVKTGTWTVLVGPSGIGKSSLPRLYAEALGMKEEFKKIEVRPDWLDDRDVIGAFNPLAGRFEPASAGLVDHLISAHEDFSKQRGGIYLVCLDEMNLARVEHYFAQFLSVMEEPLGERVLHLFSRGLERLGEPYARYRELPIGENIRFVGTVNIDETTHFFSPKVLDRASILTFEEIDHGLQAGTSLKARDLAVRPVHLDVYRGWMREAAQAPADAREIVMKVDTLIRAIGTGLGHRLLDRILRQVASAKDLLPGDRAVDLALAQSVLPRLPTHHARFPATVDALLATLPQERFARTGRMLQSMKDSGGDHGFFQLL